jgi:phosphatidylcholine synthase
MLGTPPLFNALLILGLSVLVFVPVRFLYVSRLKRGRALHIALGSAWSVACMVALLLEPGTARSALVGVSLIYPAYYTLHSLQLDWLTRQGHVVVSSNASE